MKNYSIKKTLLVLILTIGGFLSLPAYAWPEVDHMNMCGSAVKAVRAYNGGFRSWQAHDKYIAQRGNGYYFRTNCPETNAPIKKVVYKKAVKNVKKAPVKMEEASEAEIKVKAVKRISKKSHYKEKLDCARVDRVNSIGLAIQVKRR